jgi:hypothetical protein
MRIPRKQYMAGEVSHQDYYLQFVTPTIKAMVNRMQGKIDTSKDAHFNDIPLHVWDRISKIAFHELCAVNHRINGSRSASLSDGVCAAKAYAKTIKKERE